MNESDHYSIFTHLMTNTTTPINFYKRNDHKEILKILAPWRPTLEKYIPKIHFLGLITNILIIIVFSQKRVLTNRKSIFYLVILAISDFMYNFVLEIPNFLIVLKIVKYDIYQQSNLSCFLYDYLTIGFHFYSVLMTLFVTIDRFYHIFKPLKTINRKYSDSKTKFIICFLLMIFSFLIALPHGFLFEFKKSQNECDAREFFIRPFRDTKFSNYEIYFTFLEPILMWFLPGLIILILNSYVIYKIIKSNRKRRNNQILSNNSNISNNLFFAKSNFNKNNQNNQKTLGYFEDESQNCDFIQKLSLKNIKTNHQFDSESIKNEDLLNNSNNNKHLLVNSFNLSKFVLCIKSIMYNFFLIFKRIF
jgi:hypothetical protein